MCSKYDKYSKDIANKIAFNRYVFYNDCRLEESLKNAPKEIVKTALYLLKKLDLLHLADCY